MITCVHLSILGSWSFWYHALHLQELVRLISSYNRETESHVALLQGR